MKEISCHYNRPKVLADVDMALWCLSYLLKNWGNRRFRSYWDDKDRDKVSGILAMYNMDTFLKRQRLRRLLYEVYEHVKESKSEPYRLLLAEGLNDERIDPELAVVTASYTFESLVWKLVQEARLENALGKKKLWNMIRNLIEARKIRNTETDFDQCKKWRDSAVHPWLRRLKAEERKEYIEKVKTLVKLKDKER